MAKKGSFIMSVLWICLFICLIITVFQYFKSGEAEPFSFTNLVSSLSNEELPSSIKNYEIPTEWLDWTDLYLGDWTIETELFTISFNFIRDLFMNIIQVINAALYFCVGIVNLIPFVAWVLGFIV